MDSGFRGTHLAQSPQDEIVRVIGVLNLIFTDIDDLAFARKFRRY